MHIDNNIESGISSMIFLWILIFFQNPLYLDDKAFYFQSLKGLTETSFKLSICYLFITKYRSKIIFSGKETILASCFLCDNMSVFLIFF
jgi:hypothetical protein